MKLKPRLARALCFFRARFATVFFFEVYRFAAGSPDQESEEWANLGFAAYTLQLVR